MSVNDKVIEILKHESFESAIDGFRKTLIKTDDCEHGLKLFLSLDIVNSSRFKEIAENNWAEIITDLMNLIVEEYMQINSFAFPWRVIGDELIFVVPIQNLSFLRRIVHQFYSFFINQLQDILKRVKEKRNQENNTYSFNMISFKACAWIAYTVDFDATPNELIEKLKKNRLYNVSKQYKFCREQSLLEFLGNDVDAGFRVAKYTRREHFCVSFELAYLLSKETEFFKRLKIVSYQKLKGVWDNKWYPIIWYHDGDVSNCRFEDSFRYFDPDGDELIQSCLNLNNYRLKHFEFLGEEMFDVSSAFERIIKGNNLIEKMRFLEQYDSENSQRNSIRIKDDYDEFHVAVVCINIKGQALLLHRKDINRWEFGCCKSSSSESLQDIAVEEYKSQYGIDISIILDDLRKDQQPVPIALYSLKNDYKIKKGLIFLAEISDNSQVSFSKGCRYDEYKFISEEEISDFEENNNDNIVTDFSATLHSVFEIYNKHNYNSRATPHN